MRCKVVVTVEGSKSMPAREKGASNEVYSITIICTVSCPHALNRQASSLFPTSHTHENPVKLHREDRGMQSSEVTVNLAPRADRD